MMLQMTQETNERPRRPERTCVGCRTHDAQAGLVRFAFDGLRLVPDPSVRLGGRGVWVHPTAKCVRSAVRGGGFARVLRAEVPFDPKGLVASLRDAEVRRLDSLLESGVRARRLVDGTEECIAAMSRGSVSLAIVARDARASRETLRHGAERASVPVVEIDDKQRLGRCFGKDEVGAVVVCDESLAREISRVAMRIATLSEGE